MPGKKRKLNICSECKRSSKPAIHAAKSGHTGCLTTAYRELGVFNERDNFGATPIHFAARFGQLECLKWLVMRSGVSPNAVTSSGATAAHDAAATGHLNCLEYLLENTKCDAQHKTSEGATVLHLACSFGRIEVVKWLMDYLGSSPSEKGANNVTPVHLCAAKNHLQCLKWLTKHPQYTPNEETEHGATAVYFAAQEGSLECLQWLIQNASGDPYMAAEDGMSAIHAAAQAGQLACLKWLVEEAGVPIRHRSEDGATPAHFAAASGEVDCLEWVLSHGGSVLDRDSLGGTLVHDAAEQGQVKTLLHLMKKGVDMTSKDDEGLTPLDIAKENRNDECIRLLFKAQRPDILASLTPKLNMSRASASAEDEQRAAQMRQKQREFEQILLSGVSNEEREAMWQSAQEKATVVQPGLKLLLEGENGASPSAFSLEGAARITPVGSMRRRQKSTKQDEFVPTDMSPYKPRPGLTTELFDAPTDGKTKPAGTAVAKERPKGSVTTPTPQASKVELRNKPKEKQSLPPSKKAEFRHSGSGESPVPKRAKFVKKFSVPKSLSHDKPKATKTSKSKLTSKSGKNKKAETKTKKGLLSPSGEQMVQSKQRRVSSEQKPRERKISKTKEKPALASTAEQKRKISSHKKETSDKKVANLETQQLQLKSMKLTEEPNEDAQLEPINILDMPPSSYEDVAIALAEKLVQETVAMQGAAIASDENTNQHKEEVIIEKSEQRQSLLTPDETVTVTFKDASKTEQPSLFNSLKKTTEENELPSPEDSDDEGGYPQRDSFVTPGFERLDYRNFEHFGENVEDFESQRAEEDKEWQEGRRTSMRNSGVMNVPSSGKVQGETGVAKKLNFEEKVKTNRENWMEEKEDDDALRNRQEKQNLNRIDQLPPEERKRISESHEDDDLVAESASMVSVESLHIRHLNPKAVYFKMQDFERQRQERGYTQVLQIRDRLQKHDDDEDEAAVSNGKTKKSRPSSGMVVGNVSSKLQMFGEGADYAKKQTHLHHERDKTGKHPGSPIKTSLFIDEFTFDSLPSSPEKDETISDEMKESTKDEIDGPTDESPSHGKTKVKAPLSSRASTTTFETIREAEENSDENASHDLIKQPATDQAVGDESTEKVPPLPKLPPNLSRRLSQERLRLDGLLSSNEDKEASPQMDDQSQGGSKLTKADSVPVSAGAQRKRFVSFHEDSEIEPFATPIRHKQKEKSRNRPVSAPPFHRKVVQSERDYVAKEVLKAESKVDALLSAPQLTRSTLQLDLTQGSLKTWKQEAGYICPVKSATFNTKDVYIFHFVDWHGPLLHHVYQWVGSKAGYSLVHSAYEHCQTLAKCLPGRPVMHREYEGYESFSFSTALGPGARLLKKYKAAVPYLNSFLTKAMLYTFDESLSSFETIEDSRISADTLRTHCVPVILDTPLSVIVWLPKKCWENKQQKNAFSIAEMFVAHCSYPEWTPITVVIQDGEVWEFYSHFSSWPFIDLRLSEKASSLYLPVQKEPKFASPANSQIKIWQLINQELKELALEGVDKFDSTHIYLVQHMEQRYTSLYSWTEGTVYIWVGAEVEQRKETVLTAIHEARHLGNTSKTPIVIVPENLEPSQLLNLFSGIHSDTHSSPYTDYPTHTLPMLFVCEVNRGVVTFTQLQRPVTKKSLKPDKCYLLTYKASLFIRQGRRWKTGMLPSDVASNFISQFHSWKKESDFVISLHSEGNEGEVFWKWFDMQNASIQVHEVPGHSVPKGPTREQVGELLVKAREIISSEMDAEESTNKDEVPMREPSASRPIPLTQSQEATFESVEKLKEQLEDLVEGEREELNERGEESNEEEAVSEVKQMSPLRVSQAIEELSDITNGLNELLQSSAQARVEESEAAEASKPVEEEPTVSESPPSESSPPAERNLLPPSTAAEGASTSKLEEDSIPDSQVKPKKVHAAPSSEAPTQLSVTVEIAEGPSKGVYEVKVKKKSPVIVIIFKVAKVSGFALKTTSAIFEVCETLKIQCPLEDHEMIKDIIARWPSNNPPKLVLRDFASKNILWSVSPPIPKEAIRTFAKEGKVPEVSSDLLYSSKQSRTKKMKWKQSRHVLKGVGIYSIGEAKKGSKLELSASLDHRIYTPIISSIKDSEIPNKYCFIMKPPLSWKEKDMKFYCAGDFMAMARWVHGIRLIKHGLQLKGNFTAMRSRLKKVDQKAEHTLAQQST